MFDPYEAWLGIPPDQRPPTHYELLNVAPTERDPAVIRQAKMRRMADLLAQPQGMDGGVCARLINEITEAEAVLLDPARREQYDSQLAHQTTQPIDEPPAEREAAPEQSTPVNEPFSATEELPAAVGEVPVASDGAPPREERPRRPGLTRIDEVVLPILPAPAPPETMAPQMKPSRPVPARPASQEQRWQRTRRFWVLVIGAECAVALLVIVGLAYWGLSMRSTGSVASVKRTIIHGEVSPTLLPTMPSTAKVPEHDPPPDPDPEPKTETGPMHGEARPEPKGEGRGEVKPEPRHHPNAQARPPRPSRSAPPDGPALARAEKQVRDVFGDDLAKRKPAEIMAATTKLLQQGRETRDPAARYVMLREASQHAALAGNAPAALGAIDELARDYAIPALDMKAAAMEAAAKAPGVSANRLLVESILSVIDDAIAADRYEHAARLLKAAENVARINKVAPPGIAVRARELEQLRKEFETVGTTWQTLVAVPNDPEANLLIGRYLCFAKGDWARGLPHLARGSNDKLRQLAEEDLAIPLVEEDQLTLADGWWEHGETEKGLLRTRLQERAVHYYTEALPRLGGLDKEKAEKRIKLLATGQPPAGTSVVIPALRDWREVAEAKFAGDWALKAGKLAGPKEDTAWFIPYFSGDFWVSVTFVHDNFPHALAFGPGAVYAKESFWMIDVGADGQVQLRIHQGRELTPRTDVKLEPGRRVLSVRFTGRDVTLFVDGQQKLRYRREADVPEPRRFGLYTATGAINIEAISFGSNRTAGPRFDIAPEYVLYEGKWNFKYASYDGKSQSAVDYVIDALGNLTDPANKEKRGLFVRRGNEVFIEYADGAFERIAKFAAGRVQTQVYPNLKAYPNNPTAAGIGMRR